MTEIIEFRQDTATPVQVAEHLSLADSDFVPPLSGRVDLAAYADKMCLHALRFEAWHASQQLVGFLALYCNDTSSRRAFITSLSVLADWRAQGIAARLLKMAIDSSLAAGMREIELEVGAENVMAINFYRHHDFAVAQAHPGYLIMRHNLTHGDADA